MKKLIKNLFFSKSNSGSSEEKLGDVRDGYMLLKKGDDGTNTYAYIEDLALEDDRYVAFSRLYRFPKAERWISSVNHEFDQMIVFIELDCIRSASNPGNLNPIRTRVTKTQYFTESKLIHQDNVDDIKLWQDVKDLKEDSYERLEADFICSKIKP